ncbi:MAG TPA: TraR/DksA C4-type zinc finger protein [Terriglobales bacterium]|nr:TraR/DksA C4-type zinc finger protein [Terriglobales bacterium]
MLPPEARARGLERSAPGILPMPRAGAMRPVNHTAKLEGSERVTSDDLKQFEERLLGERRRLLKEMGHLETTVLKVNPRDSAGDLSGYSFHMADAGTDAYEREKAFQVASTEGRLLVEINEALRRLYSGAYGICESCGNPIAKVRLEAVPQARLCRDCKEKEERDNRPEK